MSYVIWFLIFCFVIWALKEALLDKREQSSLSISEPIEDKSKK